MDNRSIQEVARDSFEESAARDAQYEAFVEGAMFMHTRMVAIIADASRYDDNAVDPGLLEWARADLAWGATHGPRWHTVQAPPRRQPTPPEPVKAPAPTTPTVRTVPKSKDWNPDRFDALWQLLRAEVVKPETPGEAVAHLQTTFLTGVANAFYDIARMYERAATDNNAELFRLYLRDFRRSLERRMVGADPSQLH